MKAVEAEDLSTKEFAVKDDESEIKLGEGEILRERQISTRGRTRWTVKYWLRDAFWSFLVAIASDSW